MPNDRSFFLKCEAGGSSYCVGLDQVLAVLRRQSVKPNPEPDGPCGWLPGSHGSTIPVYNLAERLGTGGDNTRAGAVVVIRSAKPWGLAVDGVSRFESDAEPQPIPPEASSRREAFRGVLVRDGIPMLLLDADRLRPDRAPVYNARPSTSPAILRTTTAARAGRLLLFRPAYTNGLANGQQVLLGFSYSQVLEIVSVQELVPVPWARPYALGLIEWRKLATPIIDVGRLLGLTPAPLNATGRVLIIHSQGNPMAIPIGGDVQMKTVAQLHSAVRTVPVFDTEHTLGAFQLSKRELLVIPNLAGLR